MNSLITQIKENSEKLQKTFDFLQDISKKVSLLALNASIEAAKAGSQGKAFEVIADEISQLSNTINVNLKQIKETIQNNKDTSTQAIESISQTSHGYNRILVNTNTIQEVIEELVSSKDHIQKLNENTDDVLKQLEEMFEYLKIHMQENVENIQNVNIKAINITLKIIPILDLIEQLKTIEENSKQNILKLNTLLNQFELDNKS
ncbi:MAG: methyl-accepting chemotaxis protein [Leptospiraceae bacterium]|nr:methyl-accepting chemotaxis protein [Leptospiraceae bacterium]MDW7975756.1 methyl-accepting chemotaxis protein [Leptospiraceae bacterium]